MAGFGTTVTLADLRTNFDASTATLATNAVAGRKDQTIPFRKASLSDLDALSGRRLAWVQTDDMKVQCMFLRVTDVVAGRVVTAALTVDGGDTRFLSDVTVSVSVTTINGTVDSRPTSLDLRAVTGSIVRLKKGVRYLWTFSNANAGTTTGVVVGGIQLRSLRRDR